MQQFSESAMRLYPFRDVRLTKRFVTLIDRFTENPSASIPEACCDKATTKATYRFLDTQSLTTTTIDTGMYAETIERISGQTTILSIQDTTQIDFTGHPATKGLGYLSKEHSRGSLLHTAFAASADGLPLGVLDRRMWIRDVEDYGKRVDRKKKRPKEKESYRWEETEAAVEARVPEHVHLVSISDREADIFDYIARPRRSRHDLLIRLSQNRCLAERSEHHNLFEHVDAMPVQGCRTLKVTDHKTGISRDAQLTYRWGTATIAAPKTGGSARQTPVMATIIVVREEHAPAGVKPVEWKLLTTIAVASFEEVLRIVQWYSFRWLIERFHYVLKSGCAIEKLQLETAARLERAIVMYMIVAWRLMYMTYLARIHPDESAAEILDPHEWEALHCTVHKTRIPPEQPPNVGEAIRMIAKLGGFLGRKGDGAPGVKVIWRGYRRLMDIADTYRLFVYDVKKDVGNG